MCTNRSCNQLYSLLFARTARVLNARYNGKSNITKKELNTMKLQYSLEWSAQQLFVHVQNSTKQLFCDAAICSSENSLAGSMTIGDHYARSDSRDTSKFPRKTLDSMGARGKFKLDKFVNYCSREGLSALYAVRRHGTTMCVSMCTRARARITV